MTNIAETRTPILPSKPLSVAQAGAVSAAAVVTAAVWYAPRTTMSTIAWTPDILSERPLARMLMDVWTVIEVGQGGTLE